MLPVVALIGRPNVGKSSLFNQLTGTLNALVIDFPGTTRDRMYGEVYDDNGKPRFILIDTGGLYSQDSLLDAVQGQTNSAIHDADLILLVLDAKSGLHNDDFAILHHLRKQGKKILGIINKVDSDGNYSLNDFFDLGLSQLCKVSAKTRRGLQGLKSEIFSIVAVPVNDADVLLNIDNADNADIIKVAIIGQPNVGKSTLINTILGEERVIVASEPGTTRDSIYVPFQYKEQKLILVDTAGLRRKARVKGQIESYSVVKTLQAINAAHVIVVVLDGAREVNHQDLEILKLACESGRSLVIAVNKWDLCDASARAQFQKFSLYKLQFVSFAKMHYISALCNSGINDIFSAIFAAYNSAFANFSSKELTNVLAKLVAAHSPPQVLGSGKVKLRYAHCGGKNPQRIVIHGSRVTTLPQDYIRYLSKGFIKALKLVGAPVVLEFKAGKNPYVEQKDS